jgi:site-specific DNA-methyltransferase (adenine-specific)
MGATGLSERPNQLFFGDNLRVLRDSIAAASVDLIYLDPPFNSKRDYNLLFKTPKPPKAVKTGKSQTAVVAEEPEAESGYGEAQITAFEDTWHWGRQAEDEFREILQQPNTDVAELMQALRSFLKENDMMAYLVAMCIRLLEMHRVLKPTGSLYLHCDPTASHYLKILLDAVFRPDNFRNEIVWKRKAGRGETNLAAIRFGVSHDIILLYVKTSSANFKRQYRENNPEYISGKFTHIDESGRRFRLDNLTSPSPRPNLTYEYKGYEPPAKGWAVSRETMERMESEGRLHFPAKKSMRIQRRRYLDELEGETVDTLWDDISPINSQASERLGYPTQKPLALLERVIAASSNEGDVVLDPFCGCGTAVHAAQKLNRRWIGIDITHLAVSLIERRLKDAFPGSTFEVKGTPTDLAAARDLAERDKHQFQLWACGLVNAQPYQGGRKGADRGIDGLMYVEVGRNKTEKIIVQVKGGTNVTRSNIATLKGDVDREKAAIGLFITLAEPTREMQKEAVAAGHYESPFHGAVPKIQILSVEELLAGKRPQLPDLSRGEQTFKKAKVEDKDGKKAQPGFDF